MWIISVAVVELIQLNNKNPIKELIYKIKLLNVEPHIKRTMGNVYLRKLLLNGNQLEFVRFWFKLRFFVKCQFWSQKRKDLICNQNATSRFECDKAWVRSVNGYFERGSECWIKKKQKKTLSKTILKTLLTWSNLRPNHPSVWSFISEHFQDPRQPVSTLLPTLPGLEFQR